MGDFRVLGPVEAFGPQGPIPLGPRRMQRLVLGLLLLEAGRIIPAERLVELLWKTDPPQSPVRVLQTHVARLRSCLDPQRDASLGIRIESSGEGFAAMTDPLYVDAHRFQHLVREAGTLADPPARAAALRRALALWRGALLADAAPPELRDRLGVGLNEVRWQALESLYEAELAAGRHREVIAELTPLVDSQLPRQPLVSTLMLALYRAHRQLEALELYQETRRALVEHAGVEPSEELTRLHQRILANDGELLHRCDSGDPAIAAKPVARIAVPDDMEGFRGRAGHLAELDTLLSPGTGHTLVISAVSGAPGIGKTALAVHWAHRCHRQFRDGQLYLNLRGYSHSRPLTTQEALTRLVAAMGVAHSDIPSDPAELADCYRQSLVGKHILLVLDNAANVEQVRPLLPEPGGAVVVVTSRDHLTGLVRENGARRLMLDALAPHESREVLIALLGRDRVAGQESALAELAQTCADLPLALRIAAAHLRGRPEVSIAAFVHEITGPAVLALSKQTRAGALSVQIAFDASYRRLTEHQRRMFRLLSLQPGHSLRTEAAAALADISAAEAQAQLAVLAEGHLLDCTAHRFAQHDLLATYAGTLAEQEQTAQELHAARARLFEWFADTASQAAQALYPDVVRLPRETQRYAMPSEVDARQFLREEHDNLVAVIAQAAKHGIPDIAWRLADTLRGPFSQGAPRHDWITSTTLALAAATASQNDSGIAACHLGLGHEALTASRYLHAREHYSAAPPRDHSGLARRAGRGARRARHRVRPPRRPRPGVRPPAGDPRAPAWP